MYSLCLSCAGRRLIEANRTPLVLGLRYVSYGPSHAETCQSANGPVPAAACYLNERQVSGCPQTAAYDRHWVIAARHHAMRLRAADGIEHLQKVLQVEDEIYQRPLLSQRIYATPRRTDASRRGHQSFPPPPPADWPVAVLFWNRGGTRCAAHLPRSLSCWHSGDPVARGAS